MQCFGDLIAMEGTNANEPCRIGSIRPRRQARERRSLQPSKSQVPSGKKQRTHWFEGIFFRSAHVLARREPQCPTRASVPDEGLSARREQVRASPTRSPHGPPHGPPHDSPHTEADLRRIDGLQFPIQWKTSIWYAFAAYAEPTPDNQYTTPPPHSTTCVCRLRGTNSQQPVHRRHVFMNNNEHVSQRNATFN